MPPAPSTTPPPNQFTALFGRNGNSSTTLGVNPPKKTKKKKKKKKKEEMMDPKKMTKLVKKTPLSKPPTPKWKNYEKNMDYQLISCTNSSTMTPFSKSSSPKSANETSGRVAHPPTPSPSPPPSPPSPPPISSWKMEMCGLLKKIFKCF